MSRPLKKNYRDKPVPLITAMDSFLQNLQSDMNTLISQIRQEHDKGV